MSGQLWPLTPPSGLRQWWTEATVAATQSQDEQGPEWSPGVGQGSGRLRLGRGSQPGPGDLKPGRPALQPEFELREKSSREEVGGEGRVGCCNFRAGRAGVEAGGGGRRRGGPRCLNLSYPVRGTGARILLPCHVRGSDHSHPDTQGRRPPAPYPIARPFPNEQQ